MYRIGIDLGGTNIAGGLVGDDFKIITKASTPTGASRSSEEIAADIASLCRRICGFRKEEFLSADRLHCAADYAE